MPSLLVPPRRRGVEILDAPGTSPQLAYRSLRDVARANTLLGGTRAVLAELAAVWATLPRHSTLLDVGTGSGDIPARARARGARFGVTLETIGLERNLALASGGRRATVLAVCADARRLPFADHSIDVVVCSQVLHHFFDGDAQRVLLELDRVARQRVIVSDLHRSRLAALGIWLASFVLAFHPVSRHDGVVSVMRGFRARELQHLVETAVGGRPTVRYRLGYRVTACWSPAPRPQPQAQ
jgi:ubiquinone/menaquinone biosynthesis C-methylase UbiE